MELFKEIIGAIFTLLPIPISIGYLPVLSDVFGKKNPQNISAWGIWTVTIAFGMLYVLLWTDDYKLWTVYILQAIFISAIWIGSIIHRKKKCI